MRSSARFYASLQLAFDLLATCFRHAHASRKPGLQPGLQLARIMECGLNRRTDGRTKGRVEYIIPPATPEWRSIKIIIEVVLHSSERLVLRDTQNVFAARCYASAAYAVLSVYVCPSVCPSRSIFLPKRINIFFIFLPWRCHTILVFHTKRHGDIPTAKLRTP